jgi:hypothetical protein
VLGWLDVCNVLYEVQDAIMWFSFILSTTVFSPSGPTS